MEKKSLRFALLPVAIAALSLALAPAVAGAQEAEAAAAPATPGSGYTIHVTAPHIMGDHLISPMHHYCKVVSPEPVIECLMYGSNAPDARLMGIEYIAAKSMTRTSVPLGEWNQYWHDHAVEIEAGVVGLPDMDAEQAAKVAELVATTDGIVFITWGAHEELPDHDVQMAQAISHEIMTPAEYAAPLEAMAAEDSE